MVDDLTSKLNRSFGRACSARRASGRNHPPWWNSKIAERLRTSRHSWNLAKEEAIEWSTHRENVKLLKKEIRFVKKNSWRSFCGSIECTTEVARLRKVLTKAPLQMSTIGNCNGSWTESYENTLDSFLKCHFPSCEDAGTCVRHSHLRQLALRP